MNHSWTRAVWYKVSSCVLYALLNVAIKGCPLPYMVIALWENVIGALWLWGWTLYRPMDFTTSASRTPKGWMVLQGLCATSGSVLFVKSLQSMSLIQTIAMGFLNPLMTVTLAVLFLGEKLTKARLQAILLGTVGGVMMLVSKTSGHKASVWACPSWAWEPLGAHALFALTQIINKHLLKQTDVLVVTRSMMTSIGMILALVLTGHKGGWFPGSWSVNAMGTSILPCHAAQLWSIGLVGMLAMVAHWCHYQALKRQDVVVLLPLGSIKLAVSCVLGWVFFHETPTLWLMCGMMIVGLALKRLSWHITRSHPTSHG